MVLSTKQHLYQIPAGKSWEVLLAVIAKTKKYRHHLESVFHRQTTYYDSFDWRLYQQGWLLSLERVGAVQRWRLSALKTGEWQEQTVVDDEQLLLNGRPAGALGNQLAPILGVRALVTGVTINTTIQPVRLTDKREKTVLRLAYQTHCLLASEVEEAEAVSCQLEFLPLRGYGKSFKRIEQWLVDKAAITPVEENILEQALPLIGRVPNDYSGKLRVSLTASDPALHSVKAIFSNLVTTLLVNEDGVKEGIDTEFLHDFRIAIRRTRTGLSQLNRVIPEEIVAHFKGEFSWLGAVTSRSRDLDVHLLSFDDYLAALPLSLRADLLLLRLYIEEQQVKAHRKLVSVLTGSRYQALVTEWTRFLDSEDAFVTASGAETKMTTEAVAKKKIRGQYQRVLKAGHAIQADSPAEQYHDFRKDCKQLRYLVEFFRDLYPQKVVRRVLKTMKKLQDNLGAFQDIDVQVMALQTFAQQMVAAPKASAPTLLAMGALIETLLRHQVEVKAAFAPCFARFCQPHHEVHFQVLFQENLAPDKAVGQKKRIRQ